MGDANAGRAGGQRSVHAAVAWRCAMRCVDKSAPSATATAVVSAGLSAVVRRRMTRPLARAASSVGLACAAAVVLVSTVGAQQPTQPPARTQTRRPDTTEIRGPSPTPQVVTVRPRGAPAYSRRVLVPAFLDKDFWPSSLPPLRFVSPTGGITPDSASRATADSASRAQPAPTRPPSGTPPALLRR